MKLFNVTSKVFSMFNVFELAFMNLSSFVH